MGGQVIVYGVFAARTVRENVVGIPFGSLNSAAADMTASGGLIEDYGAVFQA
jgi:hypothetical protein